MITVTISGPPKEGKTRLASLLYDILAKANVKLTVTDDDPRFFGNDLVRRQELARYTKVSEQSLADIAHNDFRVVRLPAVHIETVTPRGRRRRKPAC